MFRKEIILINKPILGMSSDEKFLIIRMNQNYLFF